MDMKAQWQGWAQQIAALSLRERILILLTGVVLLGAMGIYGWLDDADTRLGQDRQALAAAQRDLEILTLENQGKQARLGRDPDAQVREQLARAAGSDGGSDPRPRNARGAGSSVVLLRQPAYAGAHLPQTRAADGRGAEGQPVQARDPAPAGRGLFRCLPVPESARSPASALLLEGL